MMPGQFGGSKATPIDVGCRVTGHLFWVVGLLISSLLTVSETFLGSGELTVAPGLGGMAPGGAVLVFSLVAAPLGSTSFGGKPLRYRFVDSCINQPESSMMLAKFLVQVIFECITLLLGTISYHSIYRGSQHWLDRMFDLVAVDKRASVQADPVPPEPVAQIIAVGGEAAMSQPVGAYTASLFSALTQRVTLGSAFAPPAYGGPASRSTAPGLQVRTPQSVVVDVGTGGTETPGFEMQRSSEFFGLNTPDPGIQSTGVSAYPPTANLVSSEPVMSSPDRVPAASVPSPTPEAGIDWPIPTPVRDISAGMSQTGSDSEAGVTPTRAVGPVRPPSPFIPRPSPSPSPFPPSLLTGLSQALVFQPPVGSWAAASAPPVFPSVSSARTTMVGPAEPPVVRPALAVRATRIPSLVQDETATDEEPEVIPEVVLDDGLRIKVDEPLVLGRNPLTPDTYPDVRSIRVTDETMRLFKIYMILRPVCGYIQVIDIETTDGVCIETDRERTRIPTHELWRLSEGDLVRFGGRTLKLTS